MKNEPNNNTSSGIHSSRRHSDTGMSVADFRKEISKYPKDDAKSAESIVSYFFRELLEDDRSPYLDYVGVKGNNYYELVVKILKENLQNNSAAAIEYLNTHSSVKTAVEDISMNTLEILAREIRKRTVYDETSRSRELHQEFVSNIVSSVQSDDEKEEKITRDE